jgi:hypothetical protein
LSELVTLSGRNRVGSEEMSFGLNEILLVAGALVIVVAGLRAKPTPVKVPIKKRGE